MSCLPAVLKARAPRLFWDVDPDTLNLDTHRDFILTRILTHGDERAVRCIKEMLGEGVLREFLARSASHLDPRTRSFFELVLSTKEDPWTARPLPRIKDPLFVP